MDNTNPMSSPYSSKVYTGQDSNIIYTSTPPIMSPTRQHQSQQPARGLGLYSCALPPHQTTATLVTSPQSEAWSQAPPMDHEYATSQPPDIFSAAIDPFSGWQNNQAIVGPHSPEAPGLEFCQTPSSSNMPSHRGSVSSYAPSDGSEREYTPRTKPEEEWYSSGPNEHILQRGPAHPVNYSTNSTALPSQTQDIYRQQQQQHEDMYVAQEWSKHDTVAYLNELHASPESRLPRFVDLNGMISGVGRIKKKRQRTTPEEATHDCKTCGKLFKRSYNWKSHMETHNPERKYPHPCTAMIGEQPCTKKFQRKTDLDRHFDSVSFRVSSNIYFQKADEILQVHLKARNHKCALCGNKFARRDTLRRHTEDGCPKRFELGLRDAAVIAHQQQQQQLSAHSRWSTASPIPPQVYGQPRSKSFTGVLPHLSSSIPTTTGSYPMYPQTMTLPPPPPAY